MTCSLVRCSGGCGEAGAVDVVLAPFVFCAIGAEHGEDTGLALPTVVVLRGVADAVAGAGDVEGVPVRRACFFACVCGGESVCSPGSCNTRVGVPATPCGRRVPDVVAGEAAVGEPLVGRICIELLLRDVITPGDGPREDVRDPGALVLAPNSTQNTRYVNLFAIDTTPFTLAYAFGPFKHRWGTTLTLTVTKNVENCKRANTTHDVYL